MLVLSADLAQSVRTMADSDMRAPATAGTGGF
jgi:hypothetical protein